MKKKRNLNIDLITHGDLVLSHYDWTKISRYALTHDKVLIRYEGGHNFSVYWCLYEGYWEISDACTPIADIRTAKPISEEIANKIIKKEAKPPETRPRERENWLCPF